MQYLKSFKDLDFSDIEDYYEVEKIITRRFTGKNRIYLIKWLGYPIEDCTWEPISHLDKMSNLVDTFDRNFPRSIDKRQLSKYLHSINKGYKRRIKNKNHVMHKKVLKNKSNKNNHILIDFEDFSVINKKSEEDGKDTDDDEKVESIEISVEKNEDKNIEEESGAGLTHENTETKLIKPIIIW